MRTDKRFVGVAEVFRGGQTLFASAIYKLEVLEDGAVRGRLRAPHGHRLEVSHASELLHLRLEDQCVVVFQVRRIDLAPGGWGDIEGRIMHDGPPAGD